ncbi:MAG: ATP-binding region, ATPase domain protein [Marmoricola sp.]|nr:ATP-binding region, ATPase domain protein [Marmoricola sp.]
MNALTGDGVLPAPRPDDVVGLHLPDTLNENLQLIADGVVAVAGFDAAAIRIRRGDDLVLVADTGRPELIGSRLPVHRMTRELDRAEHWGILRFVPHELATAAEEGDGWIVPAGTPSDAPDAWHPEDMLVAPLYDDQGVLRGTLAIDEPDDGRRPGPDRRKVLERFARLASRSVLSAVEREALAAQVAMAETVKSIVRTTSAQLSLAGLLEASERTLLEGFGAERLWIKTVADHEASKAEFLPDDLTGSLPPEIVAFAARAAAFCWHEQAVMTVGRGLPLPTGMARRHFDHVVSLVEGMGMASLVFVPLGAGPEVMGSLVLMRADAGRAWTSVECSALLDIGHDLGRATLNARTFEREHALVTELQALDSYKSQMIATVSHELKSPLTTVAGHLEMLRDGDVDISEGARDSLTAIDRASRRMSRVIEDLLLLRRVGEAHQPFRPAAVDLRALVDDALALTAVSARAKALEVTVVPSADPALALGERDDLDTVVVNLVSNAVKYTPHGRRVELSVSTRDDHVVLEVRDEGLGISASDRHQLFTEFFRSSNPVAVEQPGTGLGLVIVKRIVERHGGSIEVDSELGVGSTFSVVLPAAEPPLTSLPASTPSATSTVIPPPRVVRDEQRAVRPATAC